MSNAFSRFIHFGSIADPSKRKKLADAIHQQLVSGQGENIGFSNADTENFAKAIDTILSNRTLRELCSQENELAEKVTEAILDFINKAKREINTSDNHLGDEQELFNDFKKADEKSFSTKWGLISTFLKENYSKQQIDISFFDKEFKHSVAESSQGNEHRFDSAKEYFLEKWDSLLLIKQTEWELFIIDKWRKKVAQELYRQIEDLKKFKELLQPFTNVLGRLFDFSKGNWQKINFDIVKRYADLLQKDKELQRLAEMLGRMQQTEKRLEEELFSHIVIKPRWQIEHASKAELIGIKESNDLSSMLPSETALLSNELLQSIFMKKFAEKKLQTFDYQAKVLSLSKEERWEKRQTAEAKGPFIICVDTSGSMQGTPENIAKALCFAILRIAIREGRKCFLISFSTGIKTLNLTDLKNSLENLASFLSMSFHGGTDASAAIQETLRQLENNDYKKADVLVISDFIMSSLKEHLQEQIRKAKGNKTKFHSLVIGTSQNQKAIDLFDNTWIYNPNSRDSLLTLVKNINSL